ncbi:MAG: ROK family protein [Pyrinomonadaceae bacterium]|nr:ROK family protein [Pyrinomonadaceae bacterium]
MESSLGSNKNLIGVEISSSKIVAVCVDESGVLKGSFTIAIEAAQESAEQVVEAIKRAEREFGAFSVFGLAIPGLLNRDTNRVALSTHTPEHAEIDLLNEIESRTQKKIYIENDANAAAYGEYCAGAGKGSKDMFYVTLGTGVGGALIFENDLWHGNSGFAGEFGSFAINTEGLRLEDVASSRSIVDRTKSRFHQDPTSSLNEIGEENITINDIVREARNEDDFAQLMLERTGNYVGTALAGVINLLNIERVVIGGEIMEAEHLVLDAIVARAEELSFAPSFETTKIVEGLLGENAGAIGAALLSKSAS